MTDIPFAATVQGRRFFERDLPELVRQLTRIGDALERLAEQPDRALGAPDSDTDEPMKENEAS